MKKLLFVAFVLGNMAIFAQDSVVQCGNFASKAVMNGLACELEMDATDIASTGAEKVQALKMLTECTAKLSGLCNEMYDSSEDIIINSGKFAPTAVMNGLACELEIYATDIASTGAEKVQALKMLTECINDFANFYAKEI